MITLAAYYQTRNLHAFGIAIEDAELFKRHVAIRSRLLEDLLKIPFGLMRGAEAMDIGCGSGENALLLALAGANVTLVDPDPSVTERIRGLFQRFGVEDRLRDVIVCDVQSLELKPGGFDFIGAEGFLHTLPDRDAMLAKINGFLRPGGLLVLTYPDRFGSFFEFVKKAAMWRGYQLAGVADPFSPQALAVAERLLGPAFQALGSTRPFAHWWEDCMVSPFLGWDICWSLPDILAVAHEGGLGYYSSTPRAYDDSALVWYKQVPAPQERRAAVLQAYERCKFDLLVGEHLSAAPSEQALDVVGGKITQALKGWSGYFAVLANPAPRIDFADAAKALASDPIGKELGRALVDFFASFAQEDLEAFIAGYLENTQVSRRWGKSYQHLALKKEGLFG